LFILSDGFDDESVIVHPAPHRSSHVGHIRIRSKLAAIRIKVSNCMVILKQHCPALLFLEDFERERMVVDSWHPGRHASGNYRIVRRIQTVIAAIRALCFLESFKTPVRKFGLLR